MRKLISFFCVLLLVTSLCVCASAANVEKSNDIVILYTNDAHASIDGPLSYDIISALKKNFEKQYRYVLLVDAGDHLQGTAFGSMDKGASIVQLMNKTGYDLAIPGNHEFDYGMDVFQQRVQEASYPYISCNLYHQTDGTRGENLLESFQAYHFGEEIVAFIGITTPETIVKSTPAYFQDETGAFCFGISGGTDGQALYDNVQSTIDAVRRAGATKVIAVGHLGNDPSSSPWTSEEVIAHVSGLDAFIDGHSHSIVSCEQVIQADGETAVLTQAGEYLDHVGLMIIDHETGIIQSDLIAYEEILKTVKNKDGSETEVVSGYRLTSNLYTGPEWPTDYSISAQKNNWIAKVNLALKKKIGVSEVVFDNYSEDGTRLVRMQETNSGDFAADALYYLFDQMDLDVDAAIMNGGGVRNRSVTGNLTYQSCKEIHPFGNVACLQTVTGQQLLDALEWGSRFAGNDEECGGFLQVSGIRYQIDTQWPDSTQKDENGMWIGGPTGGYRVHDVEVYDKESNSWKALELKEHYRLAGYNYTLRNGGDGFNMFSSAVNVVDYVMEDYMVLANYVQAFESQTVGAENAPLLQKFPNLGIDYTSVNGSGRIVNAQTEHNQEPAEETTIPEESVSIVEETQEAVTASDVEPFPVTFLIIAVISLALLICLIVFMRKQQIIQKNDTERR